MIAYANENNQEVDAEQLTGPCVVNTLDAGEFCAEAGQWIVRFPNNKPVVIADDQFKKDFTLG